MLNLSVSGLDSRLSDHPITTPAAAAAAATSLMPNSQPLAV